MCVSISSSANGKTSQDECERQFEIIIIKGCNENDEDEKWVDVPTSFSAKITSEASSPLPIVITVPVTCTPPVSSSANNAQDMLPHTEAAEM
jgi:hypothetical protein